MNNVTEKANELISTFGKNLAIKVVNEIIHSMPTYPQSSNSKMKRLDTITFWMLVKEEIKQKNMTNEEIKKDVSVSSRLKDITDEKDLKVVEFILEYSFKDDKEIYTNGTRLVPLYRVLDAIAQKGEQYKS